MKAEDRGLASRIGPVEIHWVRSVGYFGGIGLAVAFELIDPPLALFIAAVPFLKMLNRPRAPLPVRFVSQLVDGAAKPVGGDSEGTIRLTTQGLPAPRSVARGVRRAAAEIPPVVARQPASAAPARARRIPEGRNKSQTSPGAARTGGEASPIAGSS